MREAQPGLEVSQAGWDEVVELRRECGLLPVPEPNAVEEVGTAAAGAGDRLANDRLKPVAHAVIRRAASSAASGRTRSSAIRRSGTLTRSSDSAARSG